MEAVNETKRFRHFGSGDNCKPGSNLDHVIAADHLKFKGIKGAEISVRGWPELTTETQQKAWIRKFSDHGLLYFEVQRV